MEILIAFIFGAIFGSFLNVVVDRISTDRTIVFGRSYCESCKRNLGYWELLPIVSYLFLKGRCRTCHDSIPVRLFLIEVLSGVILAGIAWAASAQFLSIFAGLTLFVIFWSYLGITFADFTYGLIPDGLVIILTIFSTAYILISGMDLQVHLLSGFGALLFFGFLFFVTRGKGMGFGDVKLSFSLGMFLGFPGIVIALYIAFLTGAIISILLVLGRRIKFYGSTIPFGPFMILGSIVTFFYKQEILNLFSKFFSF